MAQAFTKNFLGLAFLLLVQPTFAEVLPGSVQPQQVEKSFSAQGNYSPPARDNSPTPSYQRSNRNVANSAQHIKFKLNRIVLVGNTVVSTNELEPIYAEDLYKTITLNRLMTIVQSITNYYRSKGYVSSQAILIPQRARHGVVTIKIIEGYIANVAVAGCPGNAKKIVQAFGNNVQKCQPFNYSALKRNVSLVNEVPGTQVKALLLPSKTHANASDLIFLTQHQPIAGYLAYDNYGTRYIGPHQVSANLRLNSLVASGDSAQLTIAKTLKGRELSYGDLNYGIPLDSNGNRLLVGATLTKTHPLFVLADAHIDGLNKNYYTSLSLPYLRTRDTKLTYLWGFNFNNTRVTSFNTKLYADKIRSIAFGLYFDKLDNWNGATSMYADVRQGLPIWGHTTDTNRATAETSRPGGRAVYTKIDFSLSRQQTLMNNFSLYGLLRGQYSFQALLTAEQFAYGGSQFGRAYDPAELLGDKGLGATIEARYDWNIYQYHLTGAQMYAFYDVGKVWNYFSSAGLPTAISAASTGAGVRFNLTSHLSANLWIAQPLTKTVAAEAIVGKGRSARAFFSFVAAL